MGLAKNIQADKAKVFEYVDSKVGALKGVARRRVYGN